jgi:tetratricopeptide (TPR) repeat protein
MENILGRPELSRQLWEEALAIARELGDELGIAILLHRLASVLGDMERVRVLAEESLAGFRRLGFEKGEAQALTSLAEVAQAAGELERALQLLDESARKAETSGFRWWLSGVHARIAALLLELDRLADAESHAQQAVVLSQAMHDRNAIVYELGLLAEIQARLGQTERAGTLWGAIEVEEARAPVGSWLHGQVRFQPSLTDAGAEFERGTEAGRAMTLDDAVAFALAETYEVGSRGSR